MYRCNAAPSTIECGFSLPPKEGFAPLSPPHPPTVALTKQAVSLPTSTCFPAHKTHAEPKQFTLFTFISLSLLFPFFVAYQS